MAVHYLLGLSGLQTITPGRKLLYRNFFQFLDSVLVSQSKYANRKSITLLEGSIGSPCLERRRVEFEVVDVLEHHFKVDRIVVLYLDSVPVRFLNTVSLRVIIENGLQLP